MLRQVCMRDVLLPIVATAASQPATPPQLAMPPPQQHLDHHHTSPVAPVLLQLLLCLAAQPGSFNPFVLLPAPLSVAVRPFLIAQLATAG